VDVRRNDVSDIADYYFEGNCAVVFAELHFGKPERRRVDRWYLLVACQTNVESYCVAFVVRSMVSLVVGALVLPIGSGRNVRKRKEHSERGEKKQW
jgi:hypothetical protein